MKIDLVAFDSFGVKSVCTRVKTKDVTITIDPILRKNLRQCYANMQTPRSGFEPESKPRQGFMIGHYTTRARGCIFELRPDPASRI